MHSFSALVQCTHPSVHFPPKDTCLLVGLTDPSDHDLVGAKTSGLDDLGYSSDDDDEDCNDGMEEEARAIEYSYSNTIHHGRCRQANLIPGGPKPPSYDGMSATEMDFAKSEFKKKRKKYTDGLRVKRLKENNDDYKPESFSGCLAPVLRPMTDVKNVRMRLITTSLTRRCC